MEKNTANTTILFSLHALEHLSRKYMERRMREATGEDLPNNSGFIMHYLEYHEAEGPVYQKDLEKVFHLSKSTITGLVQGLEQAGYVSRESVKEDARLKRVVLTEKGRKHNNLVKKLLQEMDERMSETLTAEEKEIFIKSCEKMRNRICMESTKEDKQLC